MALMKLEQTLQQKLTDLRDRNALKGEETVFTGFKAGKNGKGPRFYLANQGDREFLRMNSNSYLGISFAKEVIEAEEQAAATFGAGPGAVRFISGTWQPHVELEKKLAQFHHREAAMIFSAAYAAIMGILPPLIDQETLVISDALNHNCIINALRLSRPGAKEIYRHLDMVDLETKLRENCGKFKRVIVVTDGIFSMRGDYAPLDSLVLLCKNFQSKFAEGIISVVDDSHGVGAFGVTGRGTEEYTGARVDILVATLGKALGVNGGYVTASQPTIDFLRETAPFYVYSNPITPSEAAAAARALEIVDSPQGLGLLDSMRQQTKKFEDGLKKLGYEVISSEHPIVPLMIRDTEKTADLVRFLFDNNILVTGLNYPVVPKGDEEIRFQISAVHTDQDIDQALNVLKKYLEPHR